MSYYDIDAILTDAEKVPGTFELDVPGLGYLDNNIGSDIKAGTNISLPLWLGEMLAVSTHHQASPLLTLDLPQSLSSRVLNALKADPVSVDLRNLTPHFYRLAERSLQLYYEEDIVEVLLDTFKTRATQIADHAHNARAGPITSSSKPAGSRTTAQPHSQSHAHINQSTASNIGGEGVEFLRGLDELERSLFRRAHEDAKAVRGWEEREGRGS